MTPPAPPRKMSILDYEPARELFFTLTAGDMTLLEATDSGDYDPGQLGLLGAFLAEIGNQMMAQAKKDADRFAMEKGKAIDHGVIFERREGGEQVRVNSSAIKATFPREEYPDLYQVSNRKGYITMRLPL